MMEPDFDDDDLIQDAYVNAFDDEYRQQQEQLDYGDEPDWEDKEEAPSGNAFRQRESESNHADPPLFVDPSSSGDIREDAESAVPAVPARLASSGIRWVETQDGDEGGHEGENNLQGLDPTAQSRLTRAAYQQQRSHLSDPFDSFYSRLQWRNTNNNNNNSTLAWKTLSTTHHTSMTAAHFSRGRSRTAATNPETQLLAFSVTPAVKSNVVQLSRHHMPLRPQHGKTCVPMTLGDGTRVHLPVKNESGECKNHNNSIDPDPSLTTGGNSRNSYALGESMDRLLDRVKRIRRLQEHDRTRRSTHIPTLSQPAYDAPAAGTHTVSPSSSSASNFVRDSMLWVDKHAPTAFSHLLSDERTNREVLRAIRAWDPYVFRREPPPRPEIHGQHQQQQQAASHLGLNAAKQVDANKDLRPEPQARVLLLSGPPGVGKTTLAHIAARHAGYRPVEVNGSDERSAPVLTERVARFMESSYTIDMLYSKNTKGTKNTIGGRPNCLILDEIDGADAKGAIAALVDIIRAEIPPKRSNSSSARTPKSAGGSSKATDVYLRRPMIFICNNKFASSLRPLLPFCRHFHVAPPTTHRLLSRLKAVLHAERITVSGGSGLLNQLITSSSGDIRACLYGLQFAASHAKVEARISRNTIHARSHEEDEHGQEDDELDLELPTQLHTVDIAPALGSILNGHGMKDERTDLAAVISLIFRKSKRNAQRWGDTASVEHQPSSSRILDVVQRHGDGSKILDCLFQNVAHIPYIDPTLDRCASAYEWLSSVDLFRSQHHFASASGGFALHALESHQAPTMAAAIHLLCRVEQRQTLTFSTREQSDLFFQMDTNRALIHKFMEGWSTQLQGGRSVRTTAMDSIPYIAWVLTDSQSSNHNFSIPSSSSTLGRAHLNEHEQAIDHHVAVLRSLGLTYIPSQDPLTSKPMMRLDPPIDRLSEYVDVPSIQKREEIPLMTKEMLARKVALDRLRRITDVSLCQAKEIFEPREIIEDKFQAKVVPSECKRQQESCPETIPSQRKKAKTTIKQENFLGIGARKAKEARSARNAARVGVFRSSSSSSIKHMKESNTGSGVPLAQVVRLKYVKGFTQAVRTPCRLEDLT